MSVSWDGKLTKVAGDFGTQPTPKHSFRVPNDLYRAAVAKAAARGENVSDVLRRALWNYVHEDERIG